MALAPMSAYYICTRNRDIPAEGLKWCNITIGIAVELYDTALDRDIMYSSTKATAAGFAGYKRIASPPVISSTSANGQSLPKYSSQDSYHLPHTQEYNHVRKNNTYEY